MKVLFKIAFYLTITAALIVAAERSAQFEKRGSNYSSVKIKDNSGNDTIIIKARLTEIPGKFPPNDLYNYVYIFKYQVVSVEKGIYNEKEVFIGQYNPLMARNQVKDKMDKYVDGNVQKFEAGAVHRIVLIKSIEKVWKDAVEDNYFDIDSEKCFALKTDIAL